MKNKNVIIGIIIAVVVLGGGFAYYKNSQSSYQSPTPTPEASESTQPTSMDTEGGTTTAPTKSGGATEAMTEEGATKEIVVENKGMTFVPNKLTVKKGETVKITFKNTGGFHDFRIDGYDVGTKQIGAGEQESFTFTADQAGEFEYYCSVGNHRQMGMKGTLTVQ